MNSWAQTPTMRGEHVLLEPLTREHAEGLRTALAGFGVQRPWYTAVPSPEEADGYIAAALEMRDAGNALPFVVRDADGKVAGSTRYYALESKVPKLTIGYTWYAPEVQRTGLNTEAKLLLLGHAFQTLGCASVFFETSWFNHASRAAIARLGAKQDGILRNHTRHPDGSLRDTVVFSIIEQEWALVKRHLQYKLASHRAGGGAGHG